MATQPDPKIEGIRRHGHSYAIVSTFLQFYKNAQGENLDPTLKAISSRMSPQYNKHIVYQYNIYQ
jgi:hypothetical protein